MPIHYLPSPFSLFQTGTAQPTHTRVCSCTTIITSIHPGCNSSLLQNLCHHLLPCESSWSTSLLLDSVLGKQRERKSQQGSGVLGDTRKTRGKKPRKQMLH